MAEIWRVHSLNPQHRSIRQAADLLARGGLLVCPTDCSYVLVHQLSEKSAHEQVLRIRELPKEHLFTLLCDSLGESAKYAQIGTTEHRILRRHCPGAYTFVLPATKMVPKRLIGPQRKTIGVRIPDSPVCHALLTEAAQPLISTTARVGGEHEPLADPDEIAQVFGPVVDGILLIDDWTYGETTIVDLVSQPPKIIRQGKGPSDALGI